MNGEGYLLYESGDIYKGKFKDGKKDGLGEFFYKASSKI